MTCRFHVFGAALLALVALPNAASAAESYDNCTGFITSLPTLVTSQGVWCLTHDVSYAPGTGNAIEIQAPNVTIDCNAFKIGNLAAGTATMAVGIRAVDRRNLTIRNCNVRGFRYGMQLTGSAGSDGSIIEDNRIEGATVIGLNIAGDNAIVRRNQVIDIGPTTAVTSYFAYGIYAWGVMEISDNTVAFVEAPGEDGSAVGITATSGAHVRGNRVRHVTAGADETGIYINGYPATVVDNDVIGRETAWSSGILCSGTPTVVRSNTIGGFAYDLWQCGPDLGNLTFEMPAAP